VARESSVIIVTRYGLDGPGSDSPWGRDFPHSTRPAVGPTYPPVQWIPGISRGWGGRGVALTILPCQGPKLKKEFSYTSASSLSFHVRFAG
jgi:hypothetical protein